VAKPCGRRSTITILFGGRRRIFPLRAIERCLLEASVEKFNNDALRFAASMMRDYGPHALESARTRAKLLESEGRWSAAALWRDVAKEIEWFQLSVDYEEFKLRPTRGKA